MKHEKEGERPNHPGKPPTGKSRLKQKEKQSQKAGDKMASSK